MAENKTANLGLSLNVQGHVALQNAVKDGFQKIDDALAGATPGADLAALEARVLAIETKLNDSNSQFFDGDPG